MPQSDPDQEKALLEEKLRIHQQIAFASGVFRADITIWTVLESLAEGVVIIDATGTILLVNSCAERMFGYQKEELIGKLHSILIPNRFRAVHEEHQADFFAAPKIRPMGQLLDLAGQRRDGSEFPLEISLSFLETINGTLVLAFVSDITLRKELEKSLQKGEELFHIMIECVRDYAIYLLDSQGYILNWNVGAERLKGYQAEEIIGKHFSCFYSEKDRSDGKPEAELRIAAAKGQFAEECWRIRKDGSGFWADVVITALRDESGTLWGFSKVTHDITERKMAEDALRESEQRFAFFMFHLPAAAWIKDLQGRYVYANREAERIFSRTFSDLYGRTDKEIFPPETARQFRENDERILQEDGHLQTVEVLQQANNIEHHSIVDKFSIPTFSGETAYVGGIAVDITELQQTKAEIARLNAELEQRVAERTAELHESEMRFRALVTAGSNVIYRMSPDWSEMRQLRGQNFIADTEEPNRNWLQEYIHPDDQSQVKEVIDEAIRTKSIFELEHRVLRVDGTLGWTLSRAVPLFDAEGEIIEWFGAASDITERKEAEAALKNMNQVLERRVAERTAELNDANQDLEAFNYTVAHDLRQPLNVVSGFCQAIKTLCGDQLTKECKEFVQGAYNGILRMNGLIDALLNFSRLARVALSLEKVDLSAMAHEVAKELKQAEPGRQVEFRIADGVVADGDANLLRAVLDNLLGNAWKYTAKRDKAAIEFDVTDIDGRPVYFVRDNGVGFDMAETEGLFTPFKRLSGAQDRRGFGIGLATVERIIQRHGGKVWAEGESDKGACFFFTLPADKASK